jgi:SpoVK/Ycf46/Vps4 family AAA+-type ATPase
MDLSGKNSAYKNYLELAKEAYSNDDFSRAKDLFLKAAEITNEITLQTKNPEIKKEYYSVTNTILNFIKEKFSEDNKQENQNNSTEKKPQESVKKTVSLEESLKKLNMLVGLENVKRTINEWIETFTLSKKREEFGLKNPVLSYHMVFLGNPGTGKTTVARLVGQIYQSLGILSEGHLVEVSAKDLVAGYVGQTAILTQNILKKSHGGVLFIDEAYSLTEGGSKDFGQEAITTILKDMDDNRNLYAVIVAGYDNKMNNFIKSNPGLMSRFSIKVFFDDYDFGSLMQIFNLFCKESDYVLDSSAFYKLEEYFKEITNYRDENFGNGREARNVFEQVVKNLAKRVSKIYAPTIEDMSTIIEEDIYFNKGKKEVFL